LRGALATKQSILAFFLLCGSMDCFASSGAHLRDPLARNDACFGCLKIESPSHLSSGEKRQPLEQVHVLFVLQQRAVQRRNAPDASSE
jgi:hypothetical protein